MLFRSTRDENVLLAELKNIIENYSEHNTKIKNAAGSLTIFNAGPVAQKLINTLDV